MTIGRRTERRTDKQTNREMDRRTDRRTDVRLGQNRHLTLMSIRQTYRHSETKVLLAIGILTDGRIDR